MDACIQAQLLSQVQFFVTPWTVAHQTPVHAISQARMLEWVVISFSRLSSQPRDLTPISFIGRWIFYHWATKVAFFMVSMLK